MPTDPPQAPTPALADLLTMSEEYAVLDRHTHGMAIPEGQSCGTCDRMKQVARKALPHVGQILSELDAQRREVSTLREALADRDEVIEDKRRLTKEIGDILDGPNAARQPSLCDLVAPIRALQQRALQAEGTVRTLEFERECAVALIHGDNGRHAEIPDEAPYLDKIRRILDGRHSATRDAIQKCIDAVEKETTLGRMGYAAESWYAAKRRALQVLTALRPPAPTTREETP